MAALRAAVFSLFAENRRGGRFLPPPPVPVLNSVQELSNVFFKILNCYNSDRASTENPEDCSFLSKLSTFWKFDPFDHEGVDPWSQNFGQEKF